MSKQPKDNTRKEYKGERNAISGYWPQYKEFGIRAYDALRSGDLVEVRVADLEKHVGKLDDVCYVTNTVVHGIQIKWSTVGTPFKYSDFFGVIGGIADGWKNLGNLYPGKKVKAILLTNRPCSTRDRGMRDGNGKATGPFSEFVASALDALTQGKRVAAKWSPVLKQLRKATGLKAGEWRAFWKDFEFKPKYPQEDLSVANAIANNRVADINRLMILFAEAAAGEHSVIRISANDIKRQLGWDTRLKTTYNHYLFAPESEFEPNQKALALLNQALSGKSKGYILLKGTPGSGKSTVLTQWCTSLPNKTVRYYAFDFRNPSSRENNESDRGDRTTFLFDLVHLLQDVGFAGEKDTLPYRDYHFLKSAVHSQLEQASSYYKTTGLPLIVAVDGLDHITREYTGCRTNLLEALPAVCDLPDGVVFVLGSQHFNFDSLRSILIQVQKEQAIVEMPPLSKDELAALIAKRLNVPDPAPELIEKCYSASQGHPLYLGYILNQLKMLGTDAIDSIAKNDGSLDDIEDYYRKLLGGDSIPPKLLDCLGLLCRVPGKTPLINLDLWGITTEQKIQLKGIKHLFTITDDTISFFHNSFRQYLIRRTAEDELTEKFSESKDRTFYERLYNYSVLSWDAGYYLYQAGKYDEFIAQFTPEALFAQMQEFRPLWSVRQDLVMGVEIARKRQDPYLLARYLLFQEQLSRMERQGLSVLSLVNDFLKMGNAPLAKGIILSNNKLHCSPGEALNLVVAFCDAGLQDVAKELFSLAYPPFMNKRIDRRETNRYRAGYEQGAWTDTSLRWAYAAANFYPWQYVREQEQLFAQQIEAFSIFYGDEFDRDHFMSDVWEEYIYGLMARDQWATFENQMNEGRSSATEDAVAVFNIWKDAILTLVEDGAAANKRVSRFFASAASAFERIPEKDKPYIEMAFLAYKAGRNTSAIEDYLGNVAWKNLGSYYLSSGNDFSTFNAHNAYVGLRAFLGYKDDLRELVPDDNRREDNQLMVYYARRVFSRARFAGLARAGGGNPSEFLSELKSYLESFDNLPRFGSNLFSYTISTQRKDFYEYIVDVAALYGESTLNEFVARFNTYLGGRYCKVDAESRRQVVMSLYKHGYSKDECAVMLDALEPMMMTDQDVDGQMNQALLQGQAWLRLQNAERAKQCFSRMIEASFGVGYRKDYQPSTYAQWIGSAIKNNPVGADTRIHWLTSRLKYLVSSSEGTRIAKRAAEELLSHVLTFNVSSGIKLARWMLDKEWSSFQSVNETIIAGLLGQTSSVEEFTHIVDFYTRVFLFTNDNATSDEDDTLLKQILEQGVRMRVDKVALTSQLRKAIITQCPPRISAVLLQKLSEIDKPIRTKEKHYDLRPSEKYADEANLLLQRGKKEEAWKKAELALAQSGNAGWDRWFDGGTRLNACILLNRIYPDKARKIVFEKVADDIINGNTLGMATYLDEIMPLVTQVVDGERLFTEEFMYMNRILRPNTEDKNDCPDVSASDESLMAGLASWLVNIVELPAIIVSERARMLLSHMLESGFMEILPVLDQSQRPAELKLELGMFLRATGSPKLSLFRDVAWENAMSSNYLHRIYARRILKKLGEEIPSPMHRTLPGTFSLIFPSDYTLASESTTTKLATLSNLNSTPGYRLAVASHIMAYLSKESGYSERAIEVRAGELLRKKGIQPMMLAPQNDRHLESVNLRCSFRRPGVQDALDAMMEVAAELIDAGAITGEIWDDLFVSYDFGDILIEENKKPDFVPCIASESIRDSVPENWTDSVKSSPRMNGPLARLDEYYVLAEHSIQKVPDTKDYTETFRSKVSLIEKENVAPGDSNTSFFYEHSAFQAPMEDYLDTGTGSPHIIIVRGGYFSSSSIRKHWLAINPSCARSFGWKLSSDDLFAWADEEGNPMVKTIYWQSGNPSYKSRFGYETGEGWLVLASPAALAQLQTVGQLYLHRALTREQTDPDRRKTALGTIIL